MKFAIATSSSPSRAEPHQPLHDEALMDALVEPLKPGVDAESPQPPQLGDESPHESCKVQKLGPWDL